MSWPTGVTLRTCTLGPDFGIVSGSDYGCDIVVSVSRPTMTWGATGSGGIGDTETLTFVPGQEVSFQLPVTDQAGWYIGGLPVDLSNGKQSHVYTLTIKPWIYNSLGRPTYSNTTLTLSGVPISTGTDPLDLDMSVAVPGSEGGTVTLPDLVSQLEAVAAAPTDSFVAGRINDPASETTAALNAAIARVGVKVFNVRNYGAVGDGATDDTAAINAAITDMAALPGTFSSAAGVLYFPAGRYVTQGGHVLPDTRRIHVRGDGQYLSFLQKEGGSTAQDLLTLNGSYCGVTDMSLNGDRDAASGDCVVLNAQATYLDRVFISGAAGNGVTVGKAASAINFRISETVIRLCKGYGVETTSGSTSTDGQWNNVNVGTSGKSGVHITASNGGQQMTNVHVWGSGIEDAGSDRDGFWILASGNMLVNCESETNMGNGIRFGSAIADETIIGGTWWGNWVSAIYGFDSKRIKIIGATVRHNAVGNTASSTSSAFAGIVNESGTDWQLVGNVSYDEALAIPAGTYNGIPAPANPFPGRAAIFTQTYAYAETNTGTGTPNNNNVTGNRWRLQDHKSGAALPIGVASVWTGNDLGTEAVPGTPSAASINLPVKYDMLRITGTAQITSITASYVGRRVTLLFTNTGASIANGGNLKLASTFTTTTTNQTITLVCDGTSWYEASRSANA